MCTYSIYQNFAKLRIKYDYKTERLVDKFLSDKILIYTSLGRSISLLKRSLESVKVIELLTVVYL